MTAEAQRTQRAAENGEDLGLVSPNSSASAFLCGPLRPLRLCGNPLPWSFIETARRVGD